MSTNHDDSSSSSKRISNIIRQYEFGDIIGSDTHGEVYYAQNIDTDEEVAIKVIKKSNVKLFSHKEVDSHREIFVLRVLSHPNVVSLIDAFEIDDIIYIVLEFVSGGSLDYLLDASETFRLNINETRYYFRQIVAALQYIHLQNIIHGDIKPSNILLTTDRQIKLSDFGSAQFVRTTSINEDDASSSSLSTTQAAVIAGGVKSIGWDGSPAFFAPEIVDDTGIDVPISGFKTDIWALGVTLYMMLTGKPPFTGRTMYAMFENICEAKYEIPDYIKTDGDLIHLIHGILDPDSNTRFTLETIAAHPWLKKDDDVECSFTPITFVAPSSSNPLVLPQRNRIDDEDVNPLTVDRAMFIAEVNELPNSDPVKENMKRKNCVIL